MKNLIDKLEREHILTKAEFLSLIENNTPELSQYLFAKSSVVRQKYYGKDVYVRGLIEFSNYCKNDCYYCGIRRSNKDVERYRLSKEEILACCEAGYELGFRTFVLQAGEDLHFTDERLVEIVSAIKSAHPDCALTLSVGERSLESYKALKQSGADRYLLRFETSSPEHYSRLHPAELSLDKRLECIAYLKSLGYATGTGIMVGSPHQTKEDLANDLLLLHVIQPEMIGIGPFIASSGTPFANEKNGTPEDTLFMLGLIRMMLPTVLLPATTALGTIDKQGREKGILAGANVIMPNLSPQNVRSKYLLYNNKISTGEEAAEGLRKLKNSMEAIGYYIVVDRGDPKKM